MAGFAVVDVETTGFAYNRTDRICEVAVVLVDPDGQVEYNYTTLVNPGRDLGAQHVHRIDATDARIAPTFDLIVGDLTHLLSGRVLVAHNSAFDTSFLAAEYTRAGLRFTPSREHTLCTMALAQQYGAPPALAACCASFGITLNEAHAALSDAQATAGLLAAYMTMSSGSSTWRDWQVFAESLEWPTPPRLSTAPVHRGRASAGPDALAQVAATFTGVVDTPGGNEYLDLLARVLADRKISQPERQALDALTGTLGLSETDRARLNRHYMMGVVDAAVADARLTQDERALIIQLSQLLGLTNLETESLLARAGTLAERVEAGLDLKPGDLVVLTGMSEARKRELAAVAQSRGLVVWPGVKKGVAAVIAQDPGSQSGKARKARDYGIPVVGEEVLAD